MKEFMHEHPWMTFFLGMAAIHGVATIVSTVAGPPRSRIPGPIPHRPIAPHAQSPIGSAQQMLHYTGAVNRGGFRSQNGMPYGPGPWPTQNASENPQQAAAPEMTGWGHGEMPTPFGLSLYSRDGWPNGGGGHGGYPYSAPWWE
jgi:hypothetical protein